MSTTEDEEYEIQRKRLEAYRKRMEAYGYHDHYEYSKADLLKKVENETASAPYANGYYYMQESDPKVKVSFIYFKKKTFFSSFNKEKK